MIPLDIPGFGFFSIEHLVLDYNGTLALDGEMLPGTREVLTMLAPLLKIHVLTADTFGLARKNLAKLPVELTVFPESDQAEAKIEFVRRLGPDSVTAIGNGRNDRKMLQASAIGIVVIQREGAAFQTLVGADVLATNILEALDLLLHPKRLVATLRS